MSTTLVVFELTVADMGRSLAFYRRLGLDIPSEADSAPHAEVTLPGDLRLLWDTIDNIKSFDPDWVRPQGGTRMALGFECDSPADVDTTYAELIDAGYEGHKQPWDAVWGMRYAMIRDPDGNGVDLFAPLPTSSSGGAEEVG